MIKIKTEEGNLVWVFNNTPMFFICDTAKFPHFIHTQKSDPQTHLKDADMFWVRLHLEFCGYKPGLLNEFGLFRTTSRKTRSRSTRS